MAERGRPGGEYYHRRERRGELPAYYRSARFAGEQPAGQAYEQAQEAIYSGSPNDLSVYRLILHQVWHVSVLGQTPPENLRHRLETILSAGEAAELPSDILQALQDRRVQSIRRAPWSERHFRPG
jgi:hypothetical protein